MESAFSLAFEQGTARCPNPVPLFGKVPRARPSCTVRFAEEVDVYIMDEVFPSVSHLHVPHHALYVWPAKPWSLLDWFRPVTPDMEQLFCKSGRTRCVAIPWQRFTKVLIPKPDGRLPVARCSIMDAFIQLARLPDDVAGDPGHGAGEPPPGPRQPDFTDNMMAQVDPQVFSTANLAAFGMTVRTWYIHHVRHVRNDAPRLVHLGTDRDEWTEQIRQAWVGLINLEEPMAFTLPTPMPARRPSEMNIALDIILSQGLQELRYSGLVTVHHVDEGIGNAQTTVAASFGTHVSGTQIVDAGDAHSVCGSSSGRACSLFFGWTPIPLDHHPGHRMRPGHSFMIQVPRDPQLAIGQSAAASTTQAAVIAHGLPGGQVEQHHNHGPPGDDPEQPGDDPPSTPSSWHPGGSAGPMFNCHIYRLRHPPLHLFMRNAAGVAMLMELARNLQVVPASLLQAHPIQVQMVGERQMDWSFIVQSIADLPSASSDALVILDVEVHFHPLGGPVQPLPASTRRVCRMTQFITREGVLGYAGVMRYCRQQQHRCLVQFNNVGWPIHHASPRRVRHGVYLRVVIPPPEDGGNTLHAIHVAEHVSAPAPVVNAPVAAPASSSATAAPPVSSTTSGQQSAFQPNLEPTPLYDQWYTNLRDIFEEQSVIEYDEEGPVLYVWTWMISHNTMQHCACPRIVRLDPVDHLWLHDLYEPWRDVLQDEAPTVLRILHPRPPHASTAIDTVHLIIEQHPRESRAAGVVSVRFHGPHEDRLLQGAYSLQRWLCVEDLVDVLRINHICDVQRCTARAGVAEFERFIRHDVPSGISIELDVRPAVCGEDESGASSHEAFVPRRIMPAAAQSLLQTNVHVLRTTPSLRVPDEDQNAPVVPVTLCLDDLVAQSQFTYIDCQRPLFLRQQVLQFATMGVEWTWQHLWWHHTTYHYLWNLPPFHGEPVEGVSVYVDGSASRQKSCAAAGAVMLLHTVHGLRWGGFIAAPCIGSPTAPRAEATALLMALLWLHNVSNDLQLQYPWLEIAYDCEHTAHIAQGRQAASHNRDIHIVLRSMVQWLELRLGCQLHWTHVQGHSGDPWNEAADTVCRHAVTTGSHSTDLQPLFDVCTFNGQDLHSVQWLWMVEQSCQGISSAPALHGHRWRLDVSAPLHNCPDAGQHPALRRRREDCPEAAAVDVPLRVGTANVLTLFPGQDFASGFLGARAEELEQQFASAGLHFVGLQETRARMTGHTTLGGFHVLSGAATNRGHNGVQLWIKREIVTPQGHIRLRDQDLHILHATSRRLLVRCAHPSLRILILVLHAPCDDSEDVLQAFWDATTNAIPAAYQSWTMCVLMDANSRVGSVASAAIGSHQADDENVKGTFLHSWLLHHGLYLPQTLEDCQVGHGDTWTHPKGNRARLDFVAVSSNITPQQVRSWVSSDIDVTIHRADHACVCAELRLPCHVADRRPRDDRLQPGQIRPQAFDWKSDVHTHAAALQAWLHTQTRPRAQWRKSHLSSDTQKLILAKKFHWKRLCDVQRHYRRALLRHLFGAWHGRTIHTGDVRPWLASCDRLCAWHRWAYDDIAPRVVAAVREDDRHFYDDLAAQAGRAADYGQHALWEAIRHVLPRWRAKRRANLRCVGPSLQDQFDHYDALEAGFETSYSTLLQECHQAQCATLGDLPLAIELRDLPSRLDVGTLGCKLRTNKAAGIDGVSPATLQEACHSDSTWVHFLLFKMWILGTEPLQGKGGLLHAIAKKEASHRIEDMRGIMLIDGISKLAHSFLRRQFVPVLHRMRHPLQLGGFTKSSTMFATAYVRAFSQLASACSLSSAVIFVDIRSAFHAMIREIVLGSNGPLHPKLAGLLETHGVDLAAVSRRTSSPPELEQLGLPECAARLLRDAHCNTWYTLGASDAVHGTSRGSRPGSPLADVAFNSLMALVMHEVQQHLDGHPALQSAMALLGIRALPVAWVDDLAIPIVATSASSLVPEIQWTLRTIIDVCASFGLHLNLKQKKTEVVPTFRGAGAPAIRRDWLVDRQGLLPLPPGDSYVRCVPRYEHLGAVFQSDGHIGPEVQHRVAKAQLAYRQVRRPIMLNRHLSVSTCLRLLDALVLPVMLHGAGNWPLLSLAQLQALVTPYMKWLRSIVNNGFWTTDQRTDTHLLFQFGCPSIPLRLAKMRLLFGFQLMKHGPLVIVDFITSVASDSTSWFHALRHALHWLVTMDPAIFIGDPMTASVVEVCTWFRDHATDGPRRVRQLYRRALHQGRVVGSAWTAHFDLKDTLMRGGAHFPDDVEAGIDMTCDLPGSFACRWCARSFTSRRQWQAHLWCSHGIASDERLFMTSLTCPACQRYFWTVNRLQIHLRNSRLQPGGCYERLTWTTAPLLEACPIEDANPASHHPRLPSVLVPTARSLADTEFASRDDADLAWSRAWNAEIDVAFEALSMCCFFPSFDDVLRGHPACHGVDPDPIIWSLTEIADADDHYQVPAGTGACALGIWALDYLRYERFAHFHPEFFERCGRAILDLVRQLPLQAV